MIDRFTLGHSLFGFIFGTYFCFLYFMITPHLTIPVVVPLEVLYFVIGAFMGLLVFASWELLETTLVKKYVYAEYFGMDNWNESLKNSLFDIVAAEISYFVYVFLAYLCTAALLFHVIGLVVAHLLLIPVIPFILNENKNKQGHESLWFRYKL